MMRRFFWDLMDGFVHDIYLLRNMYELSFNGYAEKKRSFRKKKKKKQNVVNKGYR